MLVSRPEIRAAMISKGVRVAIMAESEVTTDIPEHAFLKNDPNTNWDERARGLGGTIGVPTTTGAEENLLCYPLDRYAGESILVHEFAHTIMNLGLPFVEDGPRILDRLNEAYEKAIEAGKWANTYAAATVEEYWAEGVQDWFDTNLTSDPPNGIHNHVGSREALKQYDPEIASLIGRVFDNEWKYFCPPNSQHP